MDDDSRGSSRRIRRSCVAGLHLWRSWHGLWWFCRPVKPHWRDHKPCQDRQRAHARVEW